MSDYQPGQLNVPEHILDDWERRLERNDRVHPIIPLPDGRRVSFIVKVSGWFGTSLSVNITSDFQCCDYCRRQIRKLAYKAEPENLRYLLEDAQNIIMACDCSQHESPVVQSELHVSVGVEQQRVRVQPETPENRIKVLSPQVAANQSEQTVTRARPKSVIKVKKHNVKLLNGTTVEDEAGPAEPQNVFEDVYSAPCIRYSLDSGEQVEVTIPRQICERIIRHCDDSRRTHLEVGGLLIGNSISMERQPGGKKFFQNTVTDIIEFPTTDSSISHLTLDHNVWAKANQQFESKYNTQNRVRLGWYHTHPTQGIFFSPQDRDTHTVFTLPHQFALVVDPRSMQAGLFAWSDLESRSLIKSDQFPLRLRNESAGGSVSNSDAGSFTDSESRPFSTWRVGFYISIMVVLVSYVILDSPTFAIHPNHAILLAFAGFLSLRLWNARFFNPASLVELHVLRKLEEAIVNGWSSLIAAFARHPKVAGGISVAALIASLTLVLVYLGFMLYQGFSPHRRNLPPNPAREQLVNQGSVQMSNGVRSIILSVNEVEGANKKRRLSISSDQPLAQIVYRTASQNGEQWKVEKENNQNDPEQLFFSALLGWDLKSKSIYIAELQKSIGDNKDKSQEGKWSDSTRDLFIKKLKQLKGTDQALNIKTQGEGDNTRSQAVQLVVQ